MDKRILIIDDCQSARETLRIILRNTYEVILTATAHEGLRMLSEDISLVFLDIMLPDLNGLEVLKQIKNNHPSIPVVIITAFGTEEACINALRLGARDYIKKPFNSEEILQKVEIFVNTIGTERRKPVFMTAEKTVTQVHYQGIPTHILNGVLKVKDYVNKNYTVQLKLSDACRMAGISKTYFCYFFKNISGYTFKNYLHHVKVLKAKELLNDRDLSITEIAHLLGYDDSNYFSTVFKKILGTSPKHLKVPLINFGQKQRKIGQSERKFILKL